MSHLNEAGIGTAIKLSVDYVYAFRVVKILFQDWKETDAFKLGLIDENGKKIRSPSTLEERGAYNPFISLVFNIKRLLNKVPGGKTKIAAIATSYLLLRESIPVKKEVLDEALDAYFKDINLMTEEGVAVTTAAITNGSYDKPLMKGVIKRKPVVAVGEDGKPVEKKPETKKE